jgi:ACT domain-containing protein
MKTLNAKFLEEQLTKRITKKVELSKQGYYSSEEMALYRKIFVDGKETNIKFDLEDLTEYEVRGILDKQLDKLAAKLSNNGE